MLSSTNTCEFVRFLGFESSKMTLSAESVQPHFTLVSSDKPCRIAVQIGNSWSKAVSKDGPWSPSALVGPEPMALV